MSLPNLRPITFNLHTGIQRGDNLGMADNQCPFCNIDESRILLKNDFAVALNDGFPVAEGHALVVPQRHVRSLFDLPDAELANVWKLVSHVRRKLLDDLKADGVNVGVNDGIAAGQTVMHAHVHLIPRRIGDTADPRGGIRWIIPEKARYWDDYQS